MLCADNLHTLGAAPEAPQYRQQYLANQHKYPQKHKD